MLLSGAPIIRWHRAGFRLFWRWTSRSRGGRPQVALEIRQLIRAMSLPNPLWGTPRIHGELVKLGIDVGQTLAGQPNKSKPKIGITARMAAAQPH